MLFGVFFCFCFCFFLFFVFCFCLLFKTNCKSSISFPFWLKVKLLLMANTMAKGQVQHHRLRSYLHVWKMDSYSHCFYYFERFSKTNFGGPFSILMNLFLWSFGVWDYGHFMAINGCHFCWHRMHDFTWKHPYL